MNTASNARSKCRTFRRADWWVGVLVVLAVFVLHSATDFFGTSRHPSERIAIVAMDDPSIANMVHRPWPRDVQARLMEQLAAIRMQMSNFR